METVTTPHGRPFIRALLIDLSGNLHIGSTPTPNAVEALQLLRDSGTPFRFCSNTSKESTQSLTQRLIGMGFSIRSQQTNCDGDDREEVWTSIGAMKRALKDLNIKRPYMLLSDSARNEIEESIARPSSPDIDANAQYDSVVIGLARSRFTYDDLNTAFRVLIGEHSLSGRQTCVSDSSSLIIRPDVPLLATHRAKFIQSSSGLSLGPGPFVTALEHASGVKAHVVGKPTKEFFETVIGDFRESEFKHGERGKIAIVGDDVEADLGEGALELGLWRVLVKTGKYRPGDESRPGVIPPDEVQESFATFIASLLEGQQL